MKNPWFFKSHYGDHPVNSMVCIKRVADTETRIQIAPDGRSIETRDVNFVLNPYDEYALEEAIRLREQHGGEVTVICLGPGEAIQVLRNAIALGADHAMLLRTDTTGMDAWTVATALAEAIREKTYDLIWFGKQAVDDDNAQIGPMVAELLDMPCACQIVKLTVEGERIVVNREVEGGEEIVDMALPAVLTAQKGLNEPRYASLKDIMRSRRAPVEEREITVGDVRVETVALALPPRREAGRFIGRSLEDIPELIRRLREEAKVL
jgi:electron transfer flavoprotein beta subunit